MTSSNSFSRFSTTYEIFASTAQETFYIQRPGLEGIDSIAPLPAFLLFTISGNSKYQYKLWSGFNPVGQFQTKQEVYAYLQQLIEGLDHPIRVLRKTLTGYEEVAATTGLEGPA